MPQRGNTVWLRLLSLAVVFGLWWLLTALHIWSPLILPSPSDVWHAFVQSVTSEGPRRGLSGHFLWEHLGASLQRILKGVGYAIIVGPILGVVLASVRWVRIVVEPWLSFLRSLPPVSHKVPGPFGPAEAPTTFVMKIVPPAAK